MRYDVTTKPKAAPHFSSNIEEVDHSATCRLHLSERESRLLVRATIRQSLSSFIALWIVLRDVTRMDLDTRYVVVTVALS
jgi:hypothetical protein